MKDNGDRPSTTRETLAEYLGRWLPVHATQVRPSTLYSYQAALKWVLAPPPGAPPIGSIRLSKLTVAAFDSLYAYMDAQGIQRTAQYLHGIVRRALKDAVKKGVISKNPTDFATVPRRQRTGEEVVVVRAMEKAQAERFLNAAREEERYSALWHVLLLGALRPCEAFGLKWSDVDFDVGTVHVTRNLSRTGVDREKHPDGWVLTPPKTRRSRRTIPLPPVAMKELRKWRALQKWERQTCQGEYRDRGFVFTADLNSRTNKAGSPMDLSNLAAPFRRVMEKAGLGEYSSEPEKPAGQPGPKKNRSFKPAFRIYDLRHTGASLLLLAGVPLKVVSERLGHSTIVLTADTYGHLIGGQEHEPAAKLEAMFGTV
jgi:integrase